MNVFKWILALALFVNVTTAHALPSLIGPWSGTWGQPPYVPTGSGIVLMTITAQTPTGNVDSLAGYFDWDCGPIAAYPCSGREEFTGTLFGDMTLSLIGFNLINPVNLGLGTYLATLSPNGLSMSGPFVVAGVVAGSWSVARVPEPATLALLGMSLAGFALSRRRKQ